MAKRFFPDWIEAYVDYMAPKGAPRVFGVWAAIATIAGALERRVWLSNAIGRLYPNLYMFIVGEPGVGKTVHTNQVRKFWEELKGFHVAPSSITSASLVDILAGAKRQHTDPALDPPQQTFHSLLMPINELSVMVPKYDDSMLAILTDLFDCHPLGQRRRHNDINIKLPRPQLNMIAATQPTTLHNIVPDSAWHTGFISRVLMIYSGDPNETNLFEEQPDDTETYNRLVADLQSIGKLAGQVHCEPEMVEAFVSWHLVNKCEPVPKHPKLINYATRRKTHLLKLCMSMSAATRNDLVITLENYQQAIHYLLEAESKLNGMFKSMTFGGDHGIIESCLHFVSEQYVQSKKPVPERWVIQLLSRSTPDSYRIRHLLDTMISGGYFKVRGSNIPGSRTFVPVPAGDM